MPSKPNYNHQRAERDRAKQAKKEEKSQAKREQMALRKMGEAGGATRSDAEPGPVPGPESSE